MLRAIFLNGGETIQIPSYKLEKEPLENVIRGEVWWRFRIIDDAKRLFPDRETARDPLWDESEGLKTRWGVWEAQSYWIEKMKYKSNPEPKPVPNYRHRDYIRNLVKTYLILDTSKFPLMTAYLDEKIKGNLKEYFKDFKPSVLKQLLESSEEVIEIYYTESEGATWEELQKCYPTIFYDYSERFLKTLSSYYFRNSINVFVDVNDDGKLEAGMPIYYEKKIRKLNCKDLELLIKDAIKLASYTYEHGSKIMDKIARRIIEKYIEYNPYLQTAQGSKRADLRTSIYNIMASVIITTMEENMKNLKKVVDAFIASGYYPKISEFIMEDFLWAIIEGDIKDIAKEIKEFRF